MAIALVVNGVPEIHLSAEDGLGALQAILDERGRGGCTVTPTEAARFGVQYRIQHPGAGTEDVYLTDYPDPADGVFEDEDDDD